MKIRVATTEWDEQIYDQVKAYEHHKNGRLSIVKMYEAGNSLQKLGVVHTLI